MERRRISSAALVLCEIDGKYLQIMSLTKFAATGKRKYSPLGGALEMNDEGRKTLEEMGAEFLEGDDLRIRLDEDQYPAYRDWFLTGEGREQGPVREIIEELTKEHPVFEELSEDDFTLESIGINERQKKVERPGFEGELTFSIQEFYVLTFDAEAEKTLKNYCAEHGNDGVALVSDEERVAKTFVVNGEDASCRDLEDFMALML